MPGFLDGLKELLLGGGYQPQQGALIPTGGYDAPDASGLAAPAMMRQAPVQGAKQPGLLSQLGSYVMSPEGRLAIGTTLRAGTGDENAFQDQARIINRWDVQKTQAKALADQKAKNEAFQKGYVLDPATGKTKFQLSAYQEALKEKSYAGDMATAMKEAKELRDKAIPMQGPRNSVALYDPETETLRTLQKGDPAQTEFDPGKFYLIPDDGQGEAPAAGPAPQAAAPAGVPAPPADLVNPATAIPRGAAPTAAPANYSPQDREALAQMIATEALNQGQQGMAAAGYVAKNRAETGYGGAKSIYDAVHAPHQFEGMSRAGQVRPQDMDAARAIADQVLSGALPDPTGGATNFINKELQTSRGGAIPTWAQGEGQQIGEHTFYGGQAPRQLALNGSAGTDALAAPAAPTGQAAPAAATAPARPANLPPPPAGYRWFSPGPAAAKAQWEDLTPAEAKARGWAEGQRNALTGETKGTKETGGGTGKLNAPQTKVVNDSLHSLGVASGINSRLDKSLTALDNKLLTPSLVNSAGSWIASQTGVSTPQQRAFNSFKSDLEKLRNDSLRLNNGVQTEGDAQRAWNEIITHLNDPEFVRQRLLEVKDYNQQAIDLHKAMVTQTREDAGMAPVDFKKFEAAPLKERNTGAPQQQKMQAAAAAAKSGGGQKWVTGKTYDTPRGPMTRTATGWVPANAP